MGRLKGKPEDVGGSMTIGMADEGFVRLDWAPGFTVTGEAAERAFAAVEALSAGRAHPLLVDMTACQPPTREARAVFARKGSACRVALLGRSPVDRVIANFWLGMTTPPVPTRFFTAEAGAVAWLLAGHRD